jgi:hypothetical protein
MKAESQAGETLPQLAVNVSIAPELCAQGLRQSDVMIPRFPLGPFPHFASTCLGRKHQ